MGNKKDKRQMDEERHGYFAKATDLSRKAPTRPVGGGRLTGRAHFNYDVPQTHFFLVGQEFDHDPFPDELLIRVPKASLSLEVVHFKAEPPLGTVVRARIEDAEQPQVFERSNDHMDGEGWYMCGYNKGSTWVELNQISEPVILWSPGGDEK